MQIKKQTDEMKEFRLFILLSIVIKVSYTLQWNKETTNWSANPNQVIGDWGFNRPGYPDGLYIHGVNVLDIKPVTNLVIYDNDIHWSDALRIKILLISVYWSKYSYPSSSTIH